MHTKFVVHAKCTIFGLKREEKEDLDMYRPNFPHKKFQEGHIFVRLSVYFDRYQVLRYTLCKIQHIEINMYT